MYTQKEAWELLSKAFRHYYETGQNYFVKEDLCDDGYPYPLTTFGLCFAIRQLRRANVITYSDGCSMLDLIRQHTPGGYIWDCNQKNALKRAEFCQQIIEDIS
jgi:hypothetical protein